MNVGDGEPPFHILLQHQLACSGFTWGAVGELIGGNDLRIYRYEARPKLIAKIRQKVAAFWRSIDEGNEPPVDNSTQTGVILRAMNSPVRDEIADMEGDNELPEICSGLFHAATKRKEIEREEQGFADLYLTIPEDIPDGLRMKPLFDEDYVLIGRADHPVLQGWLDLETFCSLEHIIVSPEGGGFSGPTYVALAAVGHARRVMLSASGFLMVPEMVARSEMVALVPRRIVQGRGLALQILPPPIRVPGFTIAMAWHDRTATHPLHRWMREMIAVVARTTVSDVGV